MKKAKSPALPKGVKKSPAGKTTTVKPAAKSTKKSKK